MKTNHLPRSPRGSVLLLTIVLLVVLAIVGAAVLSRAGVEEASARAKSEFDKSVSCADAARELLISQFRAFGASPTTLVLNKNVADKQLATGHFDNLYIASVQADQGASQVNFGASDMSNRVVRARLGGELYRMTVVCATTSNGQPTRQAEVEYLVRFGI